MGGWGGEKEEEEIKWKETKDVQGGNTQASKVLLFPLGDWMRRLQRARQPRAAFLRVCLSLPLVRVCEWTRRNLGKRKCDMRELVAFICKPPGLFSSLEKKKKKEREGEISRTEQIVCVVCVRSSSRRKTAGNRPFSQQPFWRITSVWFIVKYYRHSSFQFILGKQTIY